MAERAGFEPAGRAMRLRLSKPLPSSARPTLLKETGTPGGIRTLKTLFLRQGRMPVPSPGWKKCPHATPLREVRCPPRGPRFALGRPGGKNKNQQTTSAVPARDHPVGCGVSLHVAPAGLPRTSPSPPSPAVATTACMGTAEVGREPSRGTRPATLSPCSLQGAGCPIQYGARLALIC